MSMSTFAALAATAVIGVSPMLVSSASQGQSPPDLRIPCGAVWNRLPTNLQDDLSALLDMTPAQRGPAVREIRHDALAGDYGPRVRRWAHHAADHQAERRAWLRAHLPRDLRTDLRAALDLPPDQRHDALVGIRTDALAGDYGTKVQAIATGLQQRREACRS